MSDNDWQTPEERQAQLHQAHDLKAQAVRHGLTFEAYLPPSLAEKLLDTIADGGFRDPSEFVFVAAQAFMEMEKHPDLKLELLKRKVQTGLHSGPRLSADALLAELKAEADTQKIGAPAVWVKPSKRAS
ncbi:ribbon-helix-helix domain-containing protein [Zhengella mangrovi]|uniref:ribbon-helix-helix domain-containing protein n=1 Tax=Zhengella mangrovi TaxID=1982044 RepID=UPI0010547695|nr:hypothetical protein [Zhengella mangrovi]